MFNIYIYNEIILINDESFDIAEAGNSNYFSQHNNNSAGWQGNILFLVINGNNCPLHMD